MAIDPKLVSIKKAADLPSGIPTATGEFLYFEDETLKKAEMSDLYDRVESAYLGIITPSSTIPATGSWYGTVLEAGNFNNVSPAITVNAADFDIENGTANNEVRIIITDGVATKDVRRVKGAKGDAADPAKLPLYSAIKSANIVAGTQFIDDENGNIQYRVKTGQTLLTTELPANMVGTKVEAITPDIRRKKHLSLEIGALSTGGGLSNITTRARTIDFHAIEDFNKILITAGDLFFQNVFYYNNTTFISLQTFTGLKTASLTIPANTTHIKVSFQKNPNTAEITQADIDASAVYAIGANLDLASIITDIEPIKTDFDKLNIILARNISLELGGVSLSTGNNSDNDIRIRYRTRLRLNEGGYTIKGITAGFKVSRVIYYLNGVFVKSVTSNDIAIDNTVNEVRIVFEKNVNTDVITQAEVDAFRHEVINISIEKLPVLYNMITALEETTKDWFFGKKFASIGDSITAGFIPRNYAGYPGTLSSYAKRTADLLEMSFNNKGFSGSTVGYLNGTDTTSNDPFIGRYTDLAADADIVTVMGGTNDLRKISVLGTMSDRVGTTFYGALHILAQGLLNRYVYNDLSTPSKIVFITPLKIYPNTSFNGFTIKDYRDAVIDVAQYYALPVFDAWALSGLHPEEFRTLQGTEPGYTDMYNPLVTDGVHPTNEGHAIFAKALAGFLKNLF